MSEELQTLREGIDAVDAELTRLFEQRMALAQRVGLYKKERGLPILDSVREREVLDARVAQLQNTKWAAAAREFFENIMRLSRREQQRVLAAPVESAENCLVAYQGVPGAFGHQAALQCAGEATDVLPFRSFEAVFQAVISGQAARGVLPLENSSAGSIADVYDLLGRYGCHIVGEVQVTVVHCLLGVPGAKIEDIRTVYSHEQGFLQCRAFLAGYPGWKQETYHNTAISAQYVAEQGDPCNAAIASELAGQCYGLEVLGRGIQTSSHNATRFVVVAAQPLWEPEANKATLAFTLRHERGTLHRALAAFVALGMNLTRIESRPILEKSWEYRFFVDIEGQLSPEKLTVLKDALAADCDDCRVLGHYVAARREGPHA